MTDGECTGPNAGYEPTSTGGTFSRLREQATDPTLLYSERKLAKCRRIIARHVRKAIAKGEHRVRIEAGDLVLRSTFDAMCSLTGELERNGFHAAEHKRERIGMYVTDALIIEWD